MADFKVRVAEVNGDVNCTDVKGDVFKAIEVSCVVFDTVVAELDDDDFDALFITVDLNVVIGNAVCVTSVVVSIHDVASLLK